MTSPADRTPLYQQIAEAIRQEILYGRLRAGDALPTVRDLAGEWRCTPGTVQKAYQELVQQGLVVSQPGRGTRVAAALAAPAAVLTPLRQAGLVNQAEAFLLQALSGGYAPDEVEAALRSALDRWRAVASEPSPPLGRVLRFTGSHDPAVSAMAALFGGIAPGHMLRLTFNGSLGGLIALAEGAADLAGSHLWDDATDTYNAATVQRLLPGQRLALLTLAHRRLGLIVPPGNPAGLTGLEELAAGRWRFVNRQRGTGTRVWLEAQLQRRGLSWGDQASSAGEVTTHFEVARAVAEGRADVGLGIEAAALAYGLGFVGLTTEPYEFVIPAGVWGHPAVQALTQWLATAEARAMMTTLGGYDVAEAGRVRWVG